MERLLIICFHFSFFGCSTVSSHNTLPPGTWRERGSGEKKEEDGKCVREEKGG